MSFPRRRLLPLAACAAGIAAGLALLVSAAGGPIPGRPGPDAPARPNDPYHPDPDSVSRNFRGYVWPTDASRKITSSFAEYRSTHFHGGIDISTNGSVGHNVFAVQDGYLYRIRITPNGYGKMLYVRHADGYISTYAHLNSFSTAITELARTEQRRTGTYEVDLVFDRPVLRVRRGEVIARSGDTGFGPPHLHFEIRDTLLNPVNPLLGEPFRMRDAIPPTINRLLVRPLTAGSEVNGRPEPAVFTRIPKRNGVYRLGEKLRIAGEAGLAVETRDRSNGVGGITGVHTIELSIGGRRIFRSTLNAVPILKTRQILVHYDLPMLREGRGRFQKLYVDRGNELPFYDGAPGESGVVRAADLEEGEHSFSIRCLDIYGNAATLTGTLVVIRPPQIALAAPAGGGVALVNRSGRPIAAVTVRSRSGPGAAWSDRSYPAARLEHRGDTVLLPAGLPEGDVLMVTARTAGGSASAPLVVHRGTAAGPARGVAIAHRVVGDEIRVTVTTPGLFTEPPAVFLDEAGIESAIPMRPRDPSTYEGHGRLAARNAGARAIRVSAEVNRRPASASEDLRLFSIPHDRPGEFSTGGAFAVAWDSAAAFRPLHFTVRPLGTAGRGGYLFEPTDVPLNRGIRVTLPVPDGGDGTPAIYFRGGQGWTMLETDPGPAPGTLSARIASTLGEVAVLRDGRAPTIGSLRVRAPGGKPAVSFRYHDDLSGVDLARLVITVDGAGVIPEIDGEHRRVRYAAENRLSKGRHTVAITLRDRAGNESHHERRITVP